MENSVDSRGLSADEDLSPLPSCRPACPSVSAAAPRPGRPLEAPLRSSGQPQRSAAPAQRGDSVHVSLGEKLRPRRSDEAANLHLDEDVRGQRSSVGTVWGTGRRPRASMFSLGSGRPLSLLSHHVQPPVTEVQSRWAPHLLHHAIVPALPLSSN